MNEDEFDSLRRWGEALVDDPRDEVRAAGKAILLLAAEIERLQLELWHARLGIPTAGAPPELTGPDDGTSGDDREQEELPSVLARLARAARRLQPGKRHSETRS